MSIKAAKFPVNIPRRVRYSMDFWHSASILLLAGFIFFLFPNMLRSFAILVWGSPTKGRVATIKKVTDSEGGVRFVGTYTYEGIPAGMKPLRTRFREDLSVGYPLEVMYVPRYPGLNKRGNRLTCMRDFVIGVLAGAALVIVNLRFLRAMLREVYLVRYGTAAAGRITRLEDAKSTRGYRAYDVSYEFNVSPSWVQRGRDVLVTCYSFNVGDEVLILYDPKNPSFFRSYESLLASLAWTRE